MNHCMLMMGGNGTRVGAEIPKQYIKNTGNILKIVEDFIENN